MLLRFKRLSILVLILLVGMTMPLSAQLGGSHGGLMLFGGISLPAGAFGKTDGDDAGYAKKGWFGGAEYMFSLIPGIAVVVDGRYLQHKFDDSQILSQVGNLPGVSVSVGSYTGILPMAGIRLYTASPLGIFIDAQAGYMFAKSPEVTASGPGITEKIDAQSGKALAYAASAGLDIGNTFIVGASYIMTKPKFEMTMTVAGKTTAQTAEQSMNMIQIFGGIRF